eukprot:2797263-Pyramimonas_sp.AAC.1
MLCAEVAQCCRGRPRFLRRAQFAGAPFESHHMSLTGEGPGELAILLRSAAWRVSRISDGGVDDAHFST